MTSLTVNVVGLPAPQGSKRAFVVNGRAVMSENSKKVAPWRQDVVAAVRSHLGSTIDEVGGLTGPLELHLTFFMPRPGYHYRTGKHAGELKPNAPTWCDKKPDVDKLVRSTCDALTTSGIYRDDSQVVRLTAEQRYADAATGARITITPLDAAPAAASTPTAGAVPTPEGALF